MGTSDGKRTTAHYRVITNGCKTCSHSPQSVDKLHNIKTLAQNQYTVNQLFK